MNDSLISKPVEASEIAQLVNLYTNNLLSRQTVLEELQRGGVVDPDLVVGDEIERIEEGQADREAHDAELAEEKLGQDLNRAEQFQTMAPNQPGQSEGGTPSTGQSSAKKEATEQEKTAQAAKVAQ